MHRFLAFIAVIFTFASLAGATTAHAHRYVSTPIVVLNHVDAQNVAIPVMVKVQRGDVDLGSGIVLPCGSHYAIPAIVPQLPAAPECERPALDVLALAPLWPEHRLLRPPRQA
ncbi:MAG: hypothetical protein ABS75_16920 [Pelagibacterium sp. SCN 63-23]|nr:MAG: hypothetical protein ABS75_16920 [Pelagibacterium sp. SCN 63-23]